MAHVLRSVREPLETADGGVYTVRVYGRQRGDGLWEAWVEFESLDGTVLRTLRETTQPNLIDVDYWAGGLTPVYLEGALQRAIDATRAITDRSIEGEPEVPTAALSGEAVMDPFAVYRMGEDRLRRQLGALNGRHLRGIALAYGLASADVDVEALNEAELVALIVAGVRARLAA